VLQEHRQQFDGLDEVVASIRDLEAQKAKIEKLLQAHKNLVRLQTRLSAARQVTDSLRGVEKIFDVLPSDERVTKIQNFRQAIGVTVDLATRYESAKSEFEDTVKAQDALSAVRLDEEVESQVDRTYRVIHKTVKLRDALRKAEAQLEQIKQAIAQRENELSSIQQQVISLFGELKECPTCGGEVGQDHIHVS
jgi:DNA repair exonuclease SbcCD ATPase subunit